MLDEGQRVLFEEQAVVEEEQGVLFEGKAVFDEGQGMFFEGKAVFEEEQGVLFEGKAVFEEEQGVLFEGKAVFEEEQAVFEEEKPVFEEEQPVFEEEKGVLFEEPRVSRLSRRVLQTFRALGLSITSLHGPNKEELKRTDVGTKWVYGCPLGMSGKRLSRWWAPLLLAVVWVAVGCHRKGAPIIVSEGKTFAELRAIKGDVKVQDTGADARAPYPRERLAEASEITLGDGGLAWLRRDVGGVLLASGPAHLLMHDDLIDLSRGRMFVDTSTGPAVRLKTPRGLVELSDGRTSVEVAADGNVTAYVLRGSARWGASGRAGPGELLSFDAQGTATIAPAIAWNDWTGGLATTDTSAEPTPFGVGTVGARPPGDKGKPRFSLVIQRLEVRVTVDHDFAVTEVDETFVNPSSATVEGIFSFRTPPGAVLQRFGVDRNGDMVWGRVKESAAAVAQYESNVYAGLDGESGPPHVDRTGRLLGAPLPHRAGHPKARRHTLHRVAAARGAARRKAALRLPDGSRRCAQLVATHRGAQRDARSRSRGRPSHSERDGRPAPGRARRDHGVRRGAARGSRRRAAR